MTLQPLFGTTSFEELCEALAVEFEQAVDDIEHKLQEIQGQSEAVDARLCHDIRTELERIIGQFGLAIGLAETVEEDGWHQPWMYLWNYVQLILSISVEDLRLHHDVDKLKRLALAFKARQNPPGDLLPDAS